MPNSTSPTRQPIRLGPVQETLLIPLYYRAGETQSDAPAFCDDHAVAILPQIDYDFTGFDNAWALRNDIVVRTVVFDDLVHAFVQQNPDAQIINLGAGLDARFHRVDNGRIDWHDLDMPDAIDLRNRFLPTGPRNHTIARSMFDTDWFEQVDPDPARPTLIIAEALLFYFEEHQIRDLLQKLTHRFPHGELIFQSTSPRIVGRRSTVPVLRNMGAELKWGIPTAAALRQWNPNYRLLSEQSLVDRLPHRWRYYRWAKHLPRIGPYIREVMKVSHLTWT